MESQPIKTTHLSEAIVTEILARLPLRSISRFKSISKPWKSTLESPYFRRLFVSVHKNSSSSSWSLFTPTRLKEITGFYGCETWDLRKSLALCSPQFERMAFSNGLVLIGERSKKTCFVGNPVLQQWVKIPPVRVNFSWCCLVTRVDDDGVVLSFKIVRFLEYRTNNFVYVYSSDTGIWSFKEIHCPYQINTLNYMTMNGTVYFYHISMPRVFVALDFYSESDCFRVVHYPDYSDDSLHFRRALTCSGGFVMYVRTLAQEEETVFKVWRLNNDDDSWQLLWEIGVSVMGNYYVPMAMHPFDSGIVYLWCRQNRHFVSCNLRTRNYRILRDGYSYNDDCVVDYSVCDERMDEKWGDSSLEVLFQFVLPRWMESMPCPPEVEMIDATKLLSEIASMQDTWMRNRGDHDYF